MPVTALSTPPISPPRSAAFVILLECEKGAYASDLLEQQTRDLSSRDAGLTTQIVFGCLRFQAQLDFLIRLYSSRDPARLDAPVRIAIRMAIFQLRYLERVPPHAAVHESVELVKHRKRSAAGLVNAVLRKVNRNPVDWPSLETALSCPAWLLDCWTAHFGSDAAKKIAADALAQPPSYIRVAPGTPPPPGLQLEPTSVPGAYRLLSPLPASMRLHDISSQAILPLLELAPGQSYLDLCAAPGNKTLQALETPLGLAVACDVSLKRLKDTPALCPRVVLDATESLPFSIPFDRIFIDAPCSGTGTLARNPEIKWRLKPEDLASFHSRQVALILEALKHLAPRGELLYATCSLEREENEDVIEAVLAAHGNVQRKRDLWRIPGRDQGDGFYAAVLHFI